MRKLLGLTQAELAIKVEVKAQAVSSWERERSCPKGKQLQALSKVFDKDEAWILYGDESSKKIEKQINRNNMVSLAPLFDNIYVSAGHGFENELESSCDTFYPIPSSIWDKQQNKDKIFCLIIHGESMAPILLDNAVIAVNSSKTDIIDGRIYVIRCNNRLRVKQIKEICNGIVLDSFNPEYDSETITWELFNDNECCIVGEVFWYSSELNK